MKIILIFLFAVTSTVSQQTFTSGEYGFTITFPDGWNVEKGTMSSVAMIARLNTTTSVNIVVQENEEWKDYTIDEIGTEKFKENLEKKYANYFTNFKTIDYGKTTVNTYNALYFMYNCDFSNDILRAKQYFLIKDNKMYVISTGCLEKEYENFFEIVFNDCVNTFNFTK